MSAEIGRQPGGTWGKGFESLKDRQICVWYCWWFESTLTDQKNNRSFAWCDTGFIFQIGREFDSPGCNHISINMKITEVINHGSFPDHLVVPASFKSWVDDSEIVAQVRANVSLRRYKDTFMLVKDSNILLGVVMLGESKTIADTTYDTLSVIYVFPQYRKTSATHWLVFAVKEELTNPLLVDGAIFKDGGELVMSLLKHQSIRASIIDKTTGEISAFDSLVNDPNKAYVFEQTRLGYAKDYFNTDSPIWLTVFEDVDTI